MAERIALASSSGDIEGLQRRLRELGDSATEELRGHIRQFVKDSKTEFGLYEQIRDQFINSPDEDIRKFVGGAGISLQLCSKADSIVARPPNSYPNELMFPISLERSGGAPAGLKPQRRTSRLGGIPIIILMF